MNGGERSMNLERMATHGGTVIMECSESLRHSAEQHTSGAEWVSFEWNGNTLQCRNANGILMVRNGGKSDERIYSFDRNGKLDIYRSKMSRMADAAFAVAFVLLSIAMIALPVAGMVLQLVGNSNLAVCMLIAGALLSVLLAALNHDDIPQLEVALVAMVVVNLAGIAMIKFEPVLMHTMNALANQPLGH
jgi:hypothetical protein